MVTNLLFCVLSLHLSIIAVLTLQIDKEHVTHEQVDHSSHVILLDKIFFWKKRRRKQAVSDLYLPLDRRKSKWNKAI